MATSNHSPSSIRKLKGSQFGRLTIDSSSTSRPATSLVSLL